ncbi:MAG: hypothetical protein PVJ53_12650, partial [Desulfobacterales bacterium]
MTTHTQPSASAENQDRGHVAVVYVHGMGNQRRHEEVRRLIDAIDIFLSNAYRIRGVDLISHVLQDPDCKRAVMVAHSLGTAVAHDVLLQAARHNRAYNATDPISGPIPLEKMTHWVTFGSPIDKIQYFFESYKSRHHRYKRVVEELR